MIRTVGACFRGITPARAFWWSRARVNGLRLGQERSAAVRPEQGASPLDSTPGARALVR